MVGNTVKNKFHSTTVVSFVRPSATSLCNASRVVRIRSSRSTRTPPPGTITRLILLDGVHLVGEALSARIQVTHVLVAAEAVDRADIRPLVESAVRAGAEVAAGAAPVMRAVSPVRSASPIVALAGRPQPGEARLYGRKPALVLIACGVQDPGNLGAIARAVEAAGGSGLVATNGCADPFGWKALRGSMGSAFRLPIVVDRSIEHAVARARHHGCRIVAMVPREGQPLDSADLAGPTVRARRRRRPRPAGGARRRRRGARHDSDAAAGRIAEHRDQRRADLSTRHGGSGWPASHRDVRMTPERELDRLVSELNASDIQRGSDAARLEEWLATLRDEGRQRPLSRGGCAADDSAERRPPSAGRAAARRRRDRERGAPGAARPRGRALPAPRHRRRVAAARTAGGRFRINLHRERGRAGGQHSRACRSTRRSCTSSRCPTASRR